jgi:hypothetical protein
MALYLKQRQMAQMAGLKWLMSQLVLMAKR